MRNRTAPSTVADDSERKLKVDEYETIRRVIAEFPGGQSALKEVACNGSSNETATFSHAELTQKMRVLSDIFNRMQVAFQQDSRRVHEDLKKHLGLASMDDLGAHDFSELDFNSSKTANKLMAQHICNARRQYAVDSAMYMLVDRSRSHAVAAKKSLFASSALGMRIRLDYANDTIASLKERMVQAWRKGNEHKQTIERLMKTQAKQDEDLRGICAMRAKHGEEIRSARALCEELRVVAAQRAKETKRLESALSKSDRKLANTLQTIEKLREETTIMGAGTRLRDEQIKEAKGKLSIMQSRLSEVECKVECAICNECDVDVVFHCGHTMCRKCSDDLCLRGDNCPFCRRRIGYRKKLCLGA